MSKKRGKAHLLFIICCSNAKIGGGSPEYDDSRSFLRELSSASRNNLIGCRQAILDHIRQGGGTRQGKRLHELPYNRNLRQAQDFGGSEKGEFLPARSRYAGRAYSEITESSWENRQHQVLIFSGLYGLVSPEEPIQRYSLDLGDSSITLSVWSDTLTLLLAEYAKRNEVECIIDGLGDENYRDAIDWAYLGGFAEVTHIFGSQNAGPAVLRAIGHFLGSSGLGGETDYLKSLFSSGQAFPTKYESLYFLRTIDDARILGLPLMEGTAIQTKDLRDSPSPSVPLELQDVAQDRAHYIEITCRALDQWKELPAEIRGKIPKTLSQFITNPLIPGLGAEKVRTKQGELTRIRINDGYRIHLSTERDKVIVRGIGPHRLMGIG